MAATPTDVVAPAYLSWWGLVIAGCGVFLALAVAAILLGQGGPVAPYVPDECECAPAVPPGKPHDFVVLPVHEFAGEAILNQHFSRHALSTANTCGMLPLLRRYCQEPNDSPKRAALRQKILERLALVSLEITSTSAELDCEEERADQIADYLLDVANARVRRLALWSILLGAIGSTVVNGLALWNVHQRIYRSIGILFGLAVAAVSVAALSAGQVGVLFAHQRNALGEMYESPAQTEVFPPAVWRHLNRPDERDGNPDSLRDSLLYRWQHSGELAARSADEKQRLMDLLFGSGGVYQAGELRIRANLFDQMESYVNLMKHDLRQLSLELSQVD